MPAGFKWLAHRIGLEDTQITLILLVVFLSIEANVYVSCSISLNIYSPPRLLY